MKHVILVKENKMRNIAFWWDNFILTLFNEKYKIGDQIVFWVSSYKQWIYEYWIYEYFEQFRIKEIQIDLKWLMTGYCILVIEKEYFKVCNNTKCRFKKIA